MPRLLDLFCGAGGAAMGYHQAGWEVVGVDHHDQPHYPFEFVKMDALEFIGIPSIWKKFDAIHASPPCQTWSGYRNTRDELRQVIQPEPLIAKTRCILSYLPIPYVIENVPGALFELDRPIQLCGSSFGLNVRRHRLFEVPSLNVSAPRCNHSWQTPRFPAATGRTNLRNTVEIGTWRIPLDVQQEAMGIDWMDRKELCQAIPPAYTHWLGERMLESWGECSTTRARSDGEAGTGLSVKTDTGPLR